MDSLHSSVLANISRFLTTKEIVQFSMANKKLYNKINNNNYIWIQEYNKRFVPSNRAINLNHIPDPKDLYRTESFHVIKKKLFIFSNLFFLLRKSIHYA